MEKNLCIFGSVQPVENTVVTVHLHAILIEYNILKTIRQYLYTNWHGPLQSPPHLSD